MAHSYPNPPSRPYLADGRSASYPASSSSGTYRTSSSSGTGNGRQYTGSHPASSLPPKKEPKVSFSPESLFASPLSKRRNNESRGAPNSALFSNMTSAATYAGGAIPNSGASLLALQDSLNLSASRASMSIGGRASSTTGSRIQAEEEIKAAAGEGGSEDEVDVEVSFDGIQDGGFHEGYWRARYGQR